ncbi:DMT family transporter [Acidaminobacter sp. JC074]|uniref:DMT family transporter n=1 Tax=Acidaminobacter sp. JC074 TaxID=2530199 RepID=UPI001F10487F|nr:DMT family transporter [Acidaminobacter sp. JC074]MCH4887635.1 DMT family transporter [Acidaminobacter sp. JC074]
MNKSLLYIIIFVMGFITATINSVNSILADKIGLFESVLVVHLIGLTTSVIYYLILEKDKKKSLLKVIKEKPHLVLGGLIGSVAVVSISYSVQQIGVFLVSTALVAGQFVFSFIIDLKGWFGFEKVQMNKQKILSIVLMLIGVTLLTL